MFLLVIICGWFFGYFLILPLLLFIPKLNKFIQKIGNVKTDKKFISILCFVFGLSFVLAIYSPVDKKMAFAEVREMLYAFFIFIYVYFYLVSSKNTHCRKSATLKRSVAMDGF